MSNPSESFEEWRNIPGWQEFQASSMGNIRRIAATRTTSAYHVLAQHKRKKGRYRSVNLRRNNIARTVLVHHLVALAFHGLPPSAQHQVAHWDGNPANNSYSNLRWATRQENALDKIRHGSHRGGAKIGNHNSRRISELMVREVLQLHFRGAKRKELCLRTGLDYFHIRSIVTGKIWTKIYQEIKETMQALR
jgi:hypothetical protein